MTLADLTRCLRAYAAGETSDAELQAAFAPVLAADSLDVERSESTPWDVAPDETRLFWRLLYLFESEGPGFHSRAEPITTSIFGSSGSKVSSPSVGGINPCCMLRTTEIASIAPAAPSE